VGTLPIAVQALAAGEGAANTSAGASPIFLNANENAYMGARVVKVPLAPDFSHDLDAMLAQVGQDTGLVYICNPNNPTASLTARAALERFIAKLPAQTHVLVDEAYHHFAVGSPSYSSFLEPRLDNDRVIVCRTFSKIYGLAGMRIGYGIASPKVIEQLSRFSTTQSANIAALRSAVTALDDGASLKAAQERSAADRDEFMRQARSRKLAAIPSLANFAMIDVKRPVVDVIDYFKKHGILVGRPFPPMDTHLRVTFGLPSEMRKFWATWDALAKV
jgi:histidinol-phosphate aminotransferase